MASPVATCENSWSRGIAIVGLAAGPRPIGDDPPPSAWRTAVEPGRRGGALAGRNMPVFRSKGSHSFRTSGTSGNSGKRLAPEKPMARSLPSLTSPSTEVGVTNMKWMFWPSSALATSEAPR